MTTTNQPYLHSFNIQWWVEDQIHDGDIEIDPSKIEELTHYIYHNFDSSSVWDQYERLAQWYICSQPSKEEIEADRNKLN
jgi:hypothetical protein